MPYEYAYFHIVLPKGCKEEMSKRTTNELTVVYGSVIIVTDFSIVAYFCLNNTRSN